MRLRRAWKQHLQSRAFVRSGVSAACAMAACLAGCKHSRLPEEDIEPVEVGTVTAYGVTLGPDASPKTVAYVLLRAIRDDVLAVQRHDRETLKRAWSTERSVAAPERIHADVGMARQGGAVVSEYTPAEAVYKIAMLWAPIVAHYVDALDLTREQAEEQMRVLTGSANERHVILDVENPQDHNRTTLQISMVQEKGYWRVYRVGYSAISVAQLASTAASTGAVPSGGTRPTSAPAGSQP